MKLIIDIPDDVHNKILEIYNSCEELHTRENLYQTIAKGKPYEERPQGKFTIKELEGWLHSFGYSDGTVEDMIDSFTSYAERKKGEE